jgi:hypothetical protein
MMAFVAQKAKPGTVEKKPKHMKSNWCHQDWVMTITLIINFFWESQSTLHLRDLNSANKNQDARVESQRHYL